MMPNQGNMRNRRVSSQLLAVNSASDSRAFSTERAEGEPRPQVHKDRLHVVEEAEARVAFPPRPPEVREAEEAGRRAEISNMVVDADIRVAKWAWAVLAIGHCLLIYFMVRNLG